MSKDEFLKIQTCVLKVNIHCDGCKHDVKKILQKIEGVYTTKIDSDQGKVTVSGNIDANQIIKKLIKNGKHAELWGAKPSTNNHQNQLNNQFKNLQIGGKGGGGGNNKGQAQKGGGNNQPKGGGGGGGQGQHMQQIKGFQDMKMGPNFMKDLKGLNNGNENLKTVKFKLPEDEDLSDDEFDDEEFDDDDEFDDEFDDEMAHAPPHKMKPTMSGPHMMGGQIPPHGSANGGHGGANGKKGGGGGGAPNGDGGKKGGNGNNGGGQNKNGGGGHGSGGAAFMAAKKVNDGPHGMPNMMGMNGGGNMGIRPSGGNMGIRPMGQMGQMGNLAAVQGLPAAAMGGAGRGVDHMQGNNNPYYQQQLAAMMMNQQRANGNERFQPMMYARPPPAVNYMPPYPPYPYPPPPGERADQYAMFSDENTSSCRVM